LRDGSLGQSADSIERSGFRINGGSVIGFLAPRQIDPTASLVALLLVAIVTEAMFLLLPSFVGALGDGLPRRGSASSLAMVSAWPDSDADVVGGLVDYPQPGRSTQTTWKLAARRSTNA
jgi:hypothetical protein